MANERTRSGNEGDQPAHAPPSIWEWVAAALGGALVLAVLGFLVYEALSQGPHPTPKIAVRVDTVVPYPTGYVVEFRVVNEGRATAAQVLVRGELYGDAGVVERSESTLDFVPARSARTAGLVFKNDPRRYRAEVRAVGFDIP